jgi:hypothetical protein
MAGLDKSLRKENTMSDFVLGMNAALYFGDEGEALADLTELDNARDVNLNLEKAEADATTRANSGWRATVGTLKTGTIEFEMVWKPDDAGFQAMRASYLTDALVEVACLDQDRDTSGAQGLKGSFNVTNFSRSEALEDVVKVNVTLKLYAFDEWVVVE